MRLYVEIERLLVFLVLRFFWQDNNCINYPINLKFGTDVWLLCEIICVVFWVYCCTFLVYIEARVREYKKISMHYRLRREMRLFSFLTVCNEIAVVEIIRFAWIHTNVYVSRIISCTVFGVYCANGALQGYTEISQYITAYEQKFFKISSDSLIAHKI